MLVVDDRCKYCTSLQLKRIADDLFKTPAKVSMIHGQELLSELYFGE